MTLLIRGGQVLGSSKRDVLRADIFVHGEKISAIGNFPNKKADTVIDAQGCYVSPGFIDIHTESDHTFGIFEDPAQEYALKQGITTTIGGHGGASLAPLLYGSLDAITEWSLGKEANINWHTVREFLAHIERRPLGINFGTLIGYTTIREALVGEKQRALSKNEMAIFRTLLARSLHEGGLGLSVDAKTLLSHAIPRAELKTLARLLKKHGGIFAPTFGYVHGEELVRLVETVLQIAKESNVTTLISHLLPLRDDQKHFAAALNLIASFPLSQKLYFDIPRAEETLLPIKMLLPRWAQKETNEETWAQFADPWLTSKIAKEMPYGNPSHTILVSAHRHPMFLGKSVKELMRAYGIKHPGEMLLKIMADTRFRAAVFYRHLNNEELARASRLPHALFGSYGGGAHTNTRELPAPQLLAHIPKLTRLPAKLLNLKDRGEVQEGYFADLVGFGSDGIRFVVVNGVLTVEGGVPRGVRAGKALHHKSHAHSSR